jgi:toxin HigB-1
MLLRTICEKEAQAKHELGDAVAEALKHRLSDLIAAKSVKDLVAGRPRLGDDPSHMVVDLGENHRLVFKANHTNNPVTLSDDLDWGRVSRVKILRIESDHA